VADDGEGTAGAEVGHHAESTGRSAGPLLRRPRGLKGAGSHERSPQ
jgi:hypothetical protein